MDLTDELRSERREILLDMKKQIEAENLTARTGSYVRDAVSFWEDLPEISELDSCQPYIDDITQYCDVCMRGGLLLSVIRRHNKITFYELMYRNDDEELVADWFDADECFLMEIAFEKRAVLYWYGFGKDRAQAAICFGKQFATDRERMLAIITNSLDHDTVFTP